MIFAGENSIVLAGLIATVCLAIAAYNLGNYVWGF